MEGRKELGGTDEKAERVRSTCLGGGELARVVHQKVSRQDHHREAGFKSISILAKQRAKVLPLKAFPLSADALLRWFKHFISIRGTPVLAQTLMHISRKGVKRSAYFGSYHSFILMEDAGVTTTYNLSTKS
jgi:hypothetical protein